MTFVAAEVAVDMPPAATALNLPTDENEDTTSSETLEDEDFVVFEVFFFPDVEDIDELLVVGVPFTKSNSTANTI